MKMHYIEDRKKEEIKRENCKTVLSKKEK